MDLDLENGVDYIGLRIFIVDAFVTAEQQLMYEVELLRELDYDQTQIAAAVCESNVCQSLFDPGRKRIMRNKH